MFSNSKHDRADFAQSDDLSRQVMLASQTKFRAENSCIFFLVRNVINDAPESLDLRLGLGYPRMVQKFEKIIYIF